MDVERKQACATMQLHCWACMRACSTMCIAVYAASCRDWRAAHLSMRLASPAETQRRGCHAAQNEELLSRNRSLRQDNVQLRGKLEVRLALWEYCKVPCTCCRSAQACACRRVHGSEEE